MKEWGPIAFPLAWMGILALIISLFGAGCALRFYGDEPNIQIWPSANVQLKAFDSVDLCVGCLEAEPDRAMVVLDKEPVPARIGEGPVLKSESLPPGASNVPTPDGSGEN